METYNKQQVEKALDIVAQFLTTIIDGETCVKMIEEEIEDEDLQKIICSRIAAALKTVEVMRLLQQAAAN